MSCSVLRRCRLDDQRRSGPRSPVAALLILAGGCIGSAINVGLSFARRVRALLACADGRFRSATNVGLSLARQVRAPLALADGRVRSTTNVGLSLARRVAALLVLEGPARAARPRYRRRL